MIFFPSNPYTNSLSPPVSTKRIIKKFILSKMRKFAKILRKIQKKKVNDVYKKLKVCLVIKHCVVITREPVPVFSNYIIFCSVINLSSKFFKSLCEGLWFYWY